MKTGRKKAMSLLVTLIMVLVPVLSIPPGLVQASGNTYYVSPAGNDNNLGTMKKPFKTIAKAMNFAVKPGDIVYVREGSYNEQVTFKASGSAEGGYITLRAYENEKVTLNGTGKTGGNMVEIIDKSYIRVIGLELANVKEGMKLSGSGVMIRGSGSNIEVYDCKIHDIQAKWIDTNPPSGAEPQTFHYGAGAIYVAGTRDEVPLKNIIIDGCEIYDIKTRFSPQSYSENVTVTGNVDGFKISNNYFHGEGTENILIDIQGGYGGHGAGFPVNSPARNGTVCGNYVSDTGFAAGIYVDGGKDVIIEKNTLLGKNGNEGITEGIVVAAEVLGYEASNVVIRNNIVANTENTGIRIGNPWTWFYGEWTEYCKDVKVYNNTVYNCGINWGDPFDPYYGYGNIGVFMAENVELYNNIFWSADGNDYAQDCMGVAFVTDFQAKNITSDYNLFYSSQVEDKDLKFKNIQKEYDENIGMEKVDSIQGLDEYQKITGRELYSIFAKPLFKDADGADFTQLPGSPAVNTGCSIQGNFSQEDMQGNGRPLGGSVDIGCYESKYMFSEINDIGKPIIKGSATCNEDAEYSINASGKDIWGTKDEFTFYSQKGSGDFVYTARIAEQNTANYNQKCGIMIRKTLDEGSPYASILFTKKKATVQVREKENTGTKNLKSINGFVPDPTPRYVRIEKTGNIFTFYYSTEGRDWQKVDKTATIDMGDEFYIGLAACSHDNARVVTAKFDDVTLLSK